MLKRDNFDLKRVARFSTSHKDGTVQRVNAGIVKASQGRRASLGSDLTRAFECFKDHGVTRVDHDPRREVAIPVRMRIAYVQAMSAGHGLNRS
jgi:hypothetical protein